MIEVLLEAERALSFGLLDQAERLYRQASVADPRNSIAVVGLARVALERGDEAIALAEAERALGIDAENDAARRMVERLREVRRHREALSGAPVAVPTEPEPLRPAAEPGAHAEPTTTPQPEPGPVRPAAEQDGHPEIMTAPEPEAETAPALEPASTPSVAETAPTLEPASTPSVPEPAPVPPAPAPATETPADEAEPAPTPAHEPALIPEGEAASAKPSGWGAVLAWLRRLFGRR